MAIGSSKMRSLQLPVTPAAGAVRITQALAVPLRVLIGISGPAGSLAFLSFDAGALNPVTSSFVAQGFSLGVGSSETIVIAPGQVLYIVGNVAGMSATVAESDAIPFEGGGEDAASAGSGIPSIQIQAIGAAAGLSFNNEDWIEIHPGMGLVEVRYPGQRMFVKALKNGPVMPQVSVLWPGPGGQPRQASGPVGALPRVIALWSPQRSRTSAAAAPLPTRGGGDPVGE